MLDLTSLVYALVVGFGIFGLDAAWNATTVKTDFIVSDTLGSAGIRPEFASVVFAREMESVFSTASLVRAPSVRSSHDKTFVTILADSIGFKNATAAFQDLFGMEPVAIMATLTSEGSLPRLEVVGEAGARGTFYLSLEAEAGEQTVSLIRRGAVEAATHLDPYHTALYLLDPPAGDPDVERGRRVLDRALAAQGGGAISPDRARLRNLRGIVALLDNDKTLAATLFERAIADDPELASAHLNLAFTRVEQDRYADAAMIARHVLEARHHVLRPELIASAHSVNGIVAWQQRQYQAAERHFAAAVKAEPAVSDAYYYWGRMLNSIGRTEEGAQKIRQGEINMAYFENYPEVAQLYFWMTVEDNVPLQRRPRGKGSVL